MKNLLFLAVFLQIMASCKNQEDLTPAGRIVGFIYSTDEFGHFDTDLTGVKISLQDKGVISTTISDYNGKYEFENVRQGTYNLIFTKTGYGISKVLSLSHIGGNNPTDADFNYLSKVSTTEVVDFQVGQGGGIAGKLNLPHDSNNRRRGGVVFFGRNKYVSDTNNIRALYLDIRYDYTFDEWPVSFYQNNFTEGDTVYLKAYGYSQHVYSYRNPETGKNVFPYYNQKPSETKYFIFK